MAAGILTGTTVGDVWSADALDGDGDLWWEDCVVEYTRKTSRKTSNRGPRALGRDGDLW